MDVVTAADTHTANRICHGFAQPVVRETVVTLSELISATSSRVMVA
jgi:hypothetical protein